MKEKTFIRGRDPKIQMNIGIVKNIRGWLDIQKPGESSYCIMQGDSEKGYIIDVVGDIVLDDEELKGLFMVEFGSVTGRITILNQLSKEELYSRISNFYYDVLDNCLGKTNEEQQVFLYGEANRVIETQSGKIVLSLGADLIKDSEEYIRNLPDIPTDEQINDLVKQILSGKGMGSLEYGHHAKDGFSVEMNQYAKELERRLRET